MKLKRILYLLLCILSFLLLGFCILLGASYLWMVSKWGEISVDEIIYEMSASLSGTSATLVNSYILRAAVPSAAILILLLIGIRLSGRSAAGKKTRRYYIPTALLLCLLILSSVIAHAWERISLGFYLKGLLSESSFIADNYVDPGTVRITFPEKKRNLICLYLESMEDTFMDEAHGGVYEENTIPKLTQIGMENEMFTADGMINGGNSLFGSTYTMGAIVATTCGLPIRRDLELSEMGSIYPDIRAMGDILSENGYTQIFSIGSDVNFGGRYLYFRDHGDFTIHDYNYAIETGRIPSDYHVWWGFEDEKLYEYAKEDLLELADKEEPFNYTILTVDTHFEDGYVCRLCGDEFGDDQYRNVLRCADNQAAAFIEWVQQQDFYENTTIMITGDHPSMDNTMMTLTPGDYVRKTFTCYLNAVPEYSGEEPRNYSTMDLFPTTLASIGAQIEGERLGLGTNLFSDQKTLIEESSVSHVNAELNASSDFISQLLGFSDLGSMLDAGYAFHTLYDPYHNRLYISIDGYTIESNDVARLYIHLKDENENETAVNCDQYGEAKMYRCVLPLDGLGEQLHISVVAENSEGEQTVLHEYDKTRAYLTAEREQDEYADLILGMDNAVILAAKQGNIEELNDRNRALLERLGIDAELFTEKEKGYCAVIKDGAIQEKAEDGITELGGELNEGTAYSIQSNKDAAGACTITINDVEYSQDGDGLNIVIFDLAAGKPVSASAFDLTDHTEGTSIDRYAYDPESSSLVVAMYDMETEEDRKVVGGFARVSDPEHSEWKEFPMEIYDGSDNTLAGTLNLSGYDPEDILIDLYWIDEGCGCCFGGRIQGDVT